VNDVAEHGRYLRKKADIIYVWIVSMPKKKVNMSTKKLGCAGGSGTVSTDKG
jgi:hypothetical protein